MSKWSGKYWGRVGLCENEKWCFCKLRLMIERQRIGIARALYKQADVIIFDEATSALDNETEHAVMEAIKGLNHDLTIMIIAHRLTTLQDCDQIIELGNSGILRTGTYQDIVDKAS